MFSDHLRKIKEIPYKTLLGVAGGFLILCQLVALAMVADEQVKKAQVREAQRTSERIAAAHCMESTMGAARHSCLQQAKAANLPSELVDPRQSGQAVASNFDVESSALAAHRMQDFRPAMFTPR
jgi:hypothetical protein